MVRENCGDNQLVKKRGGKNFKKWKRFLWFIQGSGGREPDQPRGANFVRGDGGFLSSATTCS